MEVLSLKHKHPIYLGGMDMKKLLAAVLTVSLILSGTTVAFAKQNEHSQKGKSQVSVSKTKAKENGINKKDLDKAKEQLTRKVDVQISQLNKLRGYIVTSDGKLLIELKDTATANAAIKSIDDALLALNDLKTKIQSATDSKALKELSKTLEKGWLKNQYFMKRIIGLTSAARFKKAYDQTLALTDKLTAGIDGLNSSNTTLNIEDLKAKLAAVKTRLESAKASYLEALNQFVTITYNDKSEKSYKAAQEKLKKAGRDLHEALKMTKRLLNLIKGTDDEEDEDDEDEDDNDEVFSAPSVTGATWSGYNALEAKAVIQFSEWMDPTKLIKTNILINVNGGGFTALDDDDAMAIGSDGKSVTLTIKHATAINTLALGVTNVSDMDGNTLNGNAAYSGTNFTLAQDSISVARVEAIAKNAVKVTFSGKLTSISTVGFSLWEKTTGVDSGITLTMATPLITIDNVSEVTFLLNADMSETALRNSHMLQLVINNATGTHNELGTRLTNAPYMADATPARDVADKILPTVTSAVRINETTLVLTFSESIKASTLTSALSGFSVTGGTASLTSVSIPAGVDGNTLILTGSGFDAATTQLNYQASSGLTDVSGNKLAGFSGKAITLQ